MLKISFDCRSSHLEGGNFTPDSLVKTPFDHPTTSRVPLTGHAERDTFFYYSTAKKFFPVTFLPSGKSFLASGCPHSYKH